MRRPRRRTAVGLGSLLLLWVACAALHVRQVVRGELGWVPVYVDAPSDPETPPRVRGVWPGVTAAQAGGLRVGDVVLAVGDEPLGGVGPIGFMARVYEGVAQAGPRVLVRYRRDGAAHRTTLALLPAAYPWRMLPLACMLVVTATLVLVRRRGAAIARGFFLAATSFALHWTFFPGGSRWQTYAWVVVFVGTSLVMLPLIVRAALIFPPDAAPARVPWWPWWFALFAPLSLGWVVGVPLSPATSVRGTFVLNVAFIVTFLGVLTRNYRRAGALGRRQLKWVVLGMYLGLLPVLATDVVVAVDPSRWWLHELAVMAEVVIPVFILIAIVRANLFDVDRLITGTAAYSLLSIGLLAAVLFGVPLLANAVSTASGLAPHVVEPLLSLAVAAGVVPGARYLQPTVERVLFRERHAFRASVDGLLRELATAADADALFRLACSRLDALLAPRACAIFVPIDRELAAVAVVGDAGAASVPAWVSIDAPVVQALRDRTTPLDVAQWRRAARVGLEAGSGEPEAAVLIPVRRGAALAAVVSLGPKRSGDVYTPTDLALLAAVGEQFAAALARFDADQTLQQERAMRDAFRRYVPEPVATRLTRGEAIEGGEQDVSVLFVDIRGYTTYSERQTADTVFSMVNRYTEMVSGVIQRRGGTVVEFLGDGLMAVFGAPEPVPDHARAAVEAACEVATAVRALALDPGGAQADPAEPIAVGVGVASGLAFVGNVRTNDRLVYTAVGDVVNLASRIERLTRDLDAAVAIDARTHHRAGAAAARFLRHAGVRIRGRTEPVDVYALPLAPA